MPKKETTKFHILKLKVFPLLLKRLGNIAGRKGMPIPDLLNLILQEYVESEEMTEDLGGDSN